MNKKILTLLLAITFIKMAGQAPTDSNADKIGVDVTNKVISPLAKVPLYDNGILIYDYDGALFSFDLDSELIAWTVKATNSQLEMCGNAVVMSDGVLYAPFINGEIIAIDNQGGDIFWKSKIGNSSNQIVLKNQIPVLHNQKLYLNAQNGTIYALNIKDGSLAWKHTFENPNNDLPVLVFDNKVFTRNGSDFYSLDAKTGKVLSQRSFEIAPNSTAVTDGENIFVANEKNVLYALTPTSLDVVWQFKFDENQHSTRERVLLKEDKIYLGTHGSDISSVYAIDTKTGTQLWKKDFKGDNIEYITEHDNSLWGYTQKRKLFQLDIENGEIVFEAKLTSSPISNLEFPEDNSLYYYCDAGLIQLDLDTKDENVMYMRTSMKDDVYNAYIKIIR
jgi:outer membrane protein assembly factor BamB